MVRTASLFSQLLQQAPRNEFAKPIAKHDAERHAKGFTCWTQFTTMLFCQLAPADLNNDNKPDLAATNLESDSLTILLAQ